MSYAFYPADLLLPPVTSFRTAISMLLLLLAGIITLCYARKVLRDSTSMPDPLSHPIYDVGGPIAAPLFDLNSAVQALEAQLLAIPAFSVLQNALDRIRASIAAAVLPNPVFDSTVIREALVDSLFVSTNRRTSLNLA